MGCRSRDAAVYIVTTYHVAEGALQCAERRVSFKLVLTYHVAEGALECAERRVDDCFVREARPRRLGEHAGGDARERGHAVRPLSGVRKFSGNDSGAETQSASG